MGSEPSDRAHDGEPHGSEDPAPIAATEGHGTTADAYAPPVPPAKATRSKFMIGVLGLLAVCVVVFVVALLLR